MESTSVVSVSQEVYECDVCNMQCAALKGLKAHKRSHENYKPRNCEICEKTFRDHATLQRHLNTSNSHRTALAKEVLHFTNIEDFKSWKVKMEKETKSQYVQHKGSRKNNDGTIVTNFYCHRDGFFNPKGKNIRALKHLGSNKINSRCPSKMIVRKRDTIVVHFFNSHSGHTMDTARLSLTQSEKDDLARKIAMHVPLQDIMDEIKDTVEDDRLQLITKKDLHNIIQTYNLNREVGTNIKSWVKYLDDFPDIIPPEGENLSSYPHETSDYDLMLADTLQQSSDYEMNEDCETRQLSDPAPSTVQVEKDKVASEVQEILNMLDTEEKINVFRKHIAPVKSLLKSMESKREVCVEDQISDESRRKLSSTKKRYIRKKQHLPKPSAINLTLDS